MDPDDEHRRAATVGPGVHDHAVVGNRAIPAQVVAGADLDLVIALTEAEAAAQDQVVLVSGVDMCADSIADLSRRDLDDRNVAAGSSVDMLDVAEVRLAYRPIRTSSACPMAARQPSDGDALSFSIWDR